MLSQIKRLFNNVDFIIVENKSDIKKTRSSNLKISCETGEGIDMLLDKIFEMTKN